MKCILLLYCTKLYFLFAYCIAWPRKSSKNLLLWLSDFVGQIPGIILVSGPCRSLLFWLLFLSLLQC